MVRPSVNQQLAEVIEQMNTAARMQDPLCYFSAEEVGRLCQRIWTNPI